MSIYASVLRLVKDNPGQTQTQLAALAGTTHDANAVNQVLAELVTDGRVTRTGSTPTGDFFNSTDNGATYASTFGQ